MAARDSLHDFFENVAQTGVQIKPARHSDTNEHETKTEGMQKPDKRPLSSESLEGYVVVEILDIDKKEPATPKKIIDKYHEENNKDLTGELTESKETKANNDETCLSSRDIKEISRDHTSRLSTTNDMDNTRYIVSGMSEHQNSQDRDRNPDMTVSNFEQPASDDESVERLMYVDDKAVHEEEDDDERTGSDDGSGEDILNDNNAAPDLTHDADRCRPTETCDVIDDEEDKYDIIRNNILVDNQSSNEKDVISDEEESNSDGSDDLSDSDSDSERDDNQIAANTTTEDKTRPRLVEGRREQFNNTNEVLQKIVLNIPLMERITECRDLRLPMPNNDHGTKRSRDKVKSDTPYPLHYPLGAMDIPSGALGDSVKLDRPTPDDIYTPVTADNTSRLNRYSTELGSISAIPGKFSETPRFGSVLREIGMRPTSGAATVISDSCGRKNPQAKVDGEVRALGRSDPAKLFSVNPFSTQSARRSLPPINKEKETGAFQSSKKETNPSQKALHRQSQPKHKVPEVRELRKPAVPRVLRSSVCYQEGKVDVSIYSDQTLINQADPVRLNINFVRQPLAPVTTTKSARPYTDTKPKLDSITRKIKSGVNPVNAVKNPQLKRPTLLVPQQNTDRKPGKYLAPIKNAPKIKKGATNEVKQKGTKNKKAACSRKLLKAVKTVGRQGQGNFWSRWVEPLDWNIVARRAQKPPFNTHTDPDASYRHMQFFMDY